MPDQNATDRVELAERLRRAAADLLALRGPVEQGEPWPLSDRFGVEPEASWGPPETLAHVAEMLPFWTGEMERVLAASEQPAPFGRVASDEVRIGIIGRDRSLPARELFTRIERDAERLAERLLELDDAQAARRGLHPTLGEIVVPGLIERFVVGHIEDHAEQLRTVLQSR
jgi:hypothetical protein